MDSGLAASRRPGMTKGREEAKQKPVFTVIFGVQFRFIFNLKRHAYLQAFS
jgi:hypothetical protein